MKQTYKKITALLMSVALVFTMMPAMAFAAEGTTGYYIESNETLKKIIPGLLGIELTGAEFSAHTEWTVNDGGSGGMSMITVYFPSSSNKASAEAKPVFEEGATTYTLTGPGGYGSPTGKVQQSYNITAAMNTGKYNMNFQIKFAPECTNPSGSSHTWKSQTVTVEPTCYSKGTLEKTCTCGYVTTSDITETSHAWSETDFTVVTEATCMKEGLKEVPCTNDGCTAKDEVTIPTIEHTWDEGVVQTPATACNQPGTMLHTCTYIDAEGTPCGTTKDEPITVGHDWDEGSVNKNATYYKEGEMLYTCNDCSTPKTEPIPVIAEPDFITDAYYLDEEGEEIPADYTADYDFQVSTGDDYFGVNWYKTTLYTVTVPEGIAKVNFAVTDIWNPATSANTIVYDEEVSRWQNIQEGYAFAGADGIREMPITSLIDTIKYAYISDSTREANYRPACTFKFVSEHVWDAGVVTKEPTCTEEGEMTYTCTYCAAEYEEVVTKTEPIEVLDHTHDREVVSEAYLATEASDEHAATYYKSCVCGDKGEETFAYGLTAKETEAMNQQIADLQEALDKAEADNTAMKSELEGKIEALETALKEASASDKEALQKEIAALQTALKAEQDANLKQQQTLTEQIAQLQKELEALKAQTNKPADKPVDTPATPDADKLADTPATPDSDKPADTPATPDADKPADTPVTPDADKPADKPAEDQPTETPADKEPVVEKQQLKAPAKVKASNVASTGKIKLTWNKVTGAKEYKVYRATSKNGKYTLMKTVKSTSYINTSAKAGKTYFYKVKAVSADKDVLASKYSAVVKKTADLKAPVVTAKAKAKKQVKLSWKKVDGAKKYVIYKATSKNGKYTKIATITKLTYTNKNLKSGKTYYYKVKAIAKNSAANSAFSTVDKCKAK